MYIYIYIYLSIYLSIYLYTHTHTHTQRVNPVTIFSPRALVQRLPRWLPSVGGGVPCGGKHIIITLHVEYAERGNEYSILFIFGLFCEYYVRVHVIHRVNQVECVIHIHRKAWISIQHVGSSPAGAPRARARCVMCALWAVPAAVSGGVPCGGKHIIITYIYICISTSISTYINLSIYISIYIYI